MQTIILSLDGRSAPGGVTIIEAINRWKLVNDAPPGSEDTLPPGAKKGDMVTMIVNTTIWWAKGGKVARELEYGRFAWKGFTLDDWDKKIKQEGRAGRSLMPKL